MALRVHVGIYASGIKYDWLTAPARYAAPAAGLALCAGFDA